MTLVALGFLDRLLRQSWRSHSMSSGWNGKRASMNCAFLRKKGKRKRTPERLCVNQCNKTAYGHDQIIWSKSIQKEWSGFSPVLASSSPHAASRGSRAALGLRHQRGNNLLRWLKYMFPKSVCVRKGFRGGCRLLTR